jgi:hypothetical protein
MRLIICVWCFATVLFAAAPKVELLHSRSVTLCEDRQATVNCISAAQEYRTLVITAQGSSSAYMVQMNVLGEKPGETRSMSFVIKRQDQRYGQGKYATFYTLPIDPGLPILEMWVHNLTWDDDGFHSTTIGR